MLEAGPKCVRKDAETFSRDLKAEKDNRASGKRRMSPKRIARGNRLRHRFVYSATSWNVKKLGQRDCDNMSARRPSHLLFFPSRPSFNARLSGSMRARSMDWKWNINKGAKDLSFRSITQWRASSHENQRYRTISALKSNTFLCCYWVLKQGIVHARSRTSW